MSAYGSRNQRQELSDALRRLRVAAGITGYDVATRMGVDQSTVSRIERNRQRISVSQVDLWCAAVGADEHRRKELLDLAESILVGPQSWAEASPDGSTNFQREAASLEARVGALCTYQPAALPGLLQTASYARRLFASGPDGAPPDLAERVVERIERQHVLYDESKTFRFVVPEAVLRWPIGEPDDPAVADEHREQLGRVLTVMDRPNVELAILPMRPTPHWRMTGFVIFDQMSDGENQVHLEWLAHPINDFEPEQIEKCRVAYENLVADSLLGSEARALVIRLINELDGTDT